MRINIKQFLLVFTVSLCALFFQNCADSMNTEEYTNQSSSSGNDSSANGSNTLPLATPPPTVEAVTISGTTVNQTIPLDSPVDLSVNASGTNVSYQWYKDDVAIPGATSASFRIAKSAISDSGLYKVTASNSVNSVTATVAVSIVRQPYQYPPVLTLAAKDVKVLRGYRNIILTPTNGDVSLVVSASNATSYQWYFKSLAAGATFTPINGAQASSYNFKLLYASTAQYGDYKVVISNAYGSIESSARVAN